MNHNEQSKRVTEGGKTHRGLDYKWVIVALCFLTILVTLGFCSSTKTLYLDVVSKALGIERSLFSLSDTFRFVSTAIVNLFFGFLVQKFGTKKLMLAGIVTLTAAMVLYSVADTLPLIYLAGALTGIGFSWTGTSMMGRIVNKWCHENRGTIMGTILAANGIGGAIAIQILSPIIEAGGEHYRNAFLISGAAVFFVGLLILFFMREKPKNCDISQPAPTKKKGRGKPWVGIPFSEVTRSPYFYAVLVCIFLTGFCLQGISGIAKSHMKDVGIDVGYITTLMTFGTLCLTLFKFLTGFLYDRFGLRFSVTTCTIGSVVGIFMLALLTDSSLGMAMAAIYKVLSALALPLETVILPIYAADLFGDRAYDKVLGIFVSVNVSGFALGAPLLNLCYDVLGTYRPILFLCAVIMLFVCITLQFIISAAHKTREKTIATLEETTA